MFLKPLFSLFLMLFSAVLMAQSPVSTTIQFPVNGDKIEQQASSDLQDALLRLDLPYRCYLVTLSGHTDADGDLTFNTALSKRRAESARAWLENEGMPTTSITMAGEGELRPLASNNSESGKARNRRVELQFTPNPAGCPKPFDFDVSFFEIDLDASQAANFSYEPSGTRIHIPGNSIIDSRGNKVSGKVTFRYREWRNPTEFLVSNITMDYPRKFSGQHFHSGGMFELRAFKDGVEVQLEPGRHAKVDFVLTDSSRNYDLFAFDNNRDQWYGPNVNPFASGGPLMNGVNNQAAQSICEESVVFDADVDTVQTFISLLDTGLYYLDQPRVDRMIEFTRLPKFKQCWNSRQYAGVDFIGDLKDEELDEYQGVTVSAKRVRKSSKWYRLHIRDARGVLTELEAINHVELYMHAKSYKKWSKNLESTFTDVRIQDISRRSAVLVLKRPSRFSIIRVMLKDKRRNRPEKKATADVLYYDKLAERESEYQTRRWTGLSAMFWEYSKVIMPQEERCMNQSEWLLHFSQKRKMMKDRYSLAKKTYQNDPEAARELITSYLDSLNFRLDQGFSIAPQPQVFVGFNTDPLVNKFMADLRVSGFGIWNCDQIARLKNPISLRPAFVDRKGKDIAMSTLSVIDNSINGVLTYNSHYRVPIAFGRDSKAVFVGVAQDGKRYYLGRKEVEKLIPYDGKMVRLSMYEIPPEVDSVKELNSLLGLRSSEKFGMR
jgi:hypothetical protein